MSISQRINSPDLLERFIRYAKIWTTSDAHINSSPTTPCQWDLLRLLLKELEDLGVEQTWMSRLSYCPASRERGRDGCTYSRFYGSCRYRRGCLRQGCTTPYTFKMERNPIILKDSVILDPAEMDDLPRLPGRL